VSEYALNDSCNVKRVSKYVLYMVRLGC